MDAELQKDIALEMANMTQGFTSSGMAKRLNREVLDVSDALKDMYLAGQLVRISIANDLGTGYYVWFTYDVLPDRVLRKLETERDEPELSPDDAARVIQFLEADLKPAAVPVIERRRPLAIPDVIEAWKLPAHLAVTLIHIKNAARWPEEARSARRWLLRFMQHKGVK